MIVQPNFQLIENLIAKYSKGEKPRYRIKWDYKDGNVIGYWVWTCNMEAINLKPSFYIYL